MFAFVFPLLIPIYYTGKKQESITWKGSNKKWRYCKGGRGGFCSSPAASLLITLRTNMKHTHATASSHTHLTSIKDTDGGPSLWGDLRSHLSAPLREKKGKEEGGRRRLEKRGYFWQLDIGPNLGFFSSSWAPNHFSICIHFFNITQHVQFGSTYSFSMAPSENYPTIYIKLLKYYMVMWYVCLLFQPSWH